MLDRKKGGWFLSQPPFLRIKWRPASPTTPISFFVSVRATDSGNYINFRSKVKRLKAASYRPVPANTPSHPLNDQLGWDLSWLFKAKKSNRLTSVASFLGKEQTNDRPRPNFRRPFSAQIY
jgi:hypothetical protein